MKKSKKQDFPDSERDALRVMKRETAKRFGEDFVRPSSMALVMYGILTTNICKTLKALCAKGLVKKISRGKYIVTKKGEKYDTGN